MPQRSFPKAGFAVAAISQMGELNQQFRPRSSMSFSTKYAILQKAT